MWAIEPQIPMTLWWVLAVAALAAVVWYAIGGKLAVSRRRRMLLTSLLAICLAGPLLISLNPIWIETIPPRPGEPMLTVLIDGTSSMKTRDLESDQQFVSRWEKAIEIAKEMNAGNSKIDVRKLAYGQQVVPFDEEGTMAKTTLTSADSAPPNASSDQKLAWPQGHRTDLAAALRHATRTGSPLGHAVVLISDGAHNAGSVESVLQSATEANALATPIYTITLGTSLGMKNLSLNTRAPRIIAFPDHPVVVQAWLGHNGLASRSTDVYLMKDDQVLQKKTVRLTNDATAEIRFELDDNQRDVITRYQIVATEVDGEVTAADNQTTVLVQQLNHPIGVLVLEGKPYWDSKFLARNLAQEPVVELTTMVQLGPQRFLRRKFARQQTLTAGESPSNSVGEANEEQGAAVAESVGENLSEWSIEKDFNSPLESFETLEQFRLVILGRDAGDFLTAQGIANLRDWISQRGGCLLCSRGAPSEQVASKLAEILPIRWTPGNEQHFRARVSQHGLNLSVFDPLVAEGTDPLGSLPSLAIGATPSARPGLPQVLLESSAGATGEDIPLVTYQPYGSGATIVVEGSGMWRWAFLPPKHADKDKIYPTLWKSMIQWIISQQDMMPGEDVAIRADRATFLSGDRATATLTVDDMDKWNREGGIRDTSLLVQSADMPAPRRVSLATSGLESGLFKADLGSLGVGYYTLKVVNGEQDEVIAATAFDVRDPWFETLEVDARPDLMRRVASISGGQELLPENAHVVVEQFQQLLKSQQQLDEKRHSLWDRPTVLIAILGIWMTTWLVRRQNGLI